MTKRAFVAQTAIVGLLWAVWACDPPQPPTPPDPPSEVVVFDIIPEYQGGAVQGAVVNVAGTERVCCENGITAWEVATEVADTPLDVLVTAAGYIPYRGIILPNSCTNGCHNRVELVPVAPEPPVVNLPWLVPNGPFFRLKNGQRFTVIEASDFNLLNRYLDGEDIEPILNQRADAGFNMLRIWSLYRLSQYGIGTLTLEDHPDLYDRIPAFCQLLARHGLYVEFTAYTSTWDTNHWGWLTAALAGITNAVIEMVNEYDLAANALPAVAETFRCPPGLLCSHGSGSSEANPKQPVFGYSGWHTNGASEEQRKVGKQAYDFFVESGVPVITNETSRYPDVGMWSGASLARQKQLACDSAAGAALLTAGSCWHSANGKNSTLWTGAALEVAREWARCAQVVPLECQQGFYVHRTDLEGPGILRVYERPVPGYDCVVKIRE